MAFAFVQTKSIDNASSTTTGTISPTSVFTIGNLVVVHIRSSVFGNTISSVTDDKSNVYANSGGPVIDPNGTALVLWQYYGVQVIGGATTITVTFTSATTNRLIVDEFSGGMSTNATIFDKSSSGVNASGVNSTTGLVTSFSPTNTGELISASAITSGADGPFTAGTSYTLGTGSDTAIASEYNLSSSTTETAPISWVTAGRWQMVAGAYKPSGSSNPTITYITYTPPFLS